MKKVKFNNKSVVTKLNEFEKFLAHWVSVTMLSCTSVEMNNSIATAREIIPELVKAP